MLIRPKLTNNDVKMTQNNVRTMLVGQNGGEWSKTMLKSGISYQILNGISAIRFQSLQVPKPM